MKILITGICGFVGSTLARALLASAENLQVVGVDNFIRPGSELNRRELAKLGVNIIHADVRSASDFEALPAADYVIDAAANRDFLNYSLNWLMDRQELLAGIGPRPVTEFRLQVTRQEQQQLNWLLLGALPGGVLIFGWLVWLVRRK